uniref:Uncharacterized protein n=1 Tax=Romanomermis culicivorax TaxID=13658 RepID=A0A915KTN2_ROMCU
MGGTSNPQLCGHMTTRGSSGWGGSVSELAWRGHRFTSANGSPPPPVHFHHRGISATGSLPTPGHFCHWPSRTVGAPPSSTVQQSRASESQLSASESSHPHAKRSNLQ